MNRGSSAASCPSSVPPGDGHGSGLGHSECRRVCSNCRKVLRQITRTLNLCAPKDLSMLQS